MLIRCRLLYELKGYFIGKTYNNKYFLVKKNEFIHHFKKGGDYSFFCDLVDKLFFSILIPLDEEEVLRNSTVYRC
ncbi:MAG: hypothetical protein ACLR3R_19745 [Clostridium paraputrificum]